MTDASGPLLPTLDAARASMGALVTRVGWPFGRAVDLFEEAPESVERLAGMALYASGVRRDAWAGEVELSAARFEELSRLALPAPAREDREHQALDARKPVTRRRCTGCPLRVGYGPCAECLGTGRVPLPDGAPDGAAPGWANCRRCDRGFVRCTTCDGAGTSVTATLVHAHDHVVVTRRLALPPVPPPVAAAARELVLSDEEPDAAYARDAGAVTLATAYRGSAATDASEFFGHALSDTPARIRDELVVFATAPGMHEVVTRTFARPFLLVRWSVGGGRHAVVAPVGKLIRAVLADDDGRGHRGD